MTLPNIQYRVPPLSSREARAALSLGSVAWAYLAALYRGDWLRSSTLLGLFQELYNQERRAASLGFEDRAEAEAILPQSLRLDGRYNEQTRVALAGSIISALDLVQGLGPAALNVADRMPLQAHQLGNWFWSSLTPLNPIDSPRGGVGAMMWDVDRMSRFSDPQTAAMNVRGLILPYITGGANAVPAGAVGGSSVTEGRNITTGHSPADVVANLTRQDATEPAVAMPGFLVTGQTPGAGTPDWAWYVVGFGALALGGILVYQLQRRRGVRRRRR